jgi:hypothetical protein
MEAKPAAARAASRQQNAENMNMHKREDPQGQRRKSAILCPA